MKISGIYQIQSKIKPERIYIGSGVNIQSRWWYHARKLRNNIHDNKRLQNHYNKYGVEDLVYSVLLSCDRDSLISTEQFFIDALNPFFNICKTAGSTLGRKSWCKGLKLWYTPPCAFKKGHTPKHKGTKGLFPNPHKGEKLSEERKSQMSEAMRLY
jgi:group I intron endonuclease